MSLSARPLRSNSELPTSASSFLLKHIRQLGIKVVPVNDISCILPNIQIDESSLPVLLPQVRNKADLLAIRENLINDSTLSADEKGFIVNLYNVATSIETIGTGDSKTDTLVDEILHLLTFHLFPLLLRHRPRFTVDVGEQRITAIPEFMFGQFEATTGVIVDVATIYILSNIQSDKRMRNISVSSGFGESQISIKMLSAAYENYVKNLNQGTVKDQTMYAIRVISNYVTFYRATVTVDYLEELAFGIPKTKTLEITRFPGGNGIDSGLDLVDAQQRKVALTGMKILGHALIEIIQ